MSTSITNYDGGITVACCTAVVTICVSTWLMAMRSGVRALDAMWQ